MKKKNFMTLTAAVLFSGFVCNAAAFEITKDTAVILPEKPLKSTVLAADELVKYV